MILQEVIEVTRPSQPRYVVLLAAIFGFVLSSGACAGGLDRPLSPSEKQALQDFSNRAKDYLAKTHALDVEKQKPSSDIVQLERRRVLLRKAIQQSRPDAKQGDVFTPEAAKVFRTLLAETLAGPDGAKIKASLNHAEPTASPNFIVNGLFPNDKGRPTQSVPASLLGNLPTLPKGLEYSLAGKTLALRDADANMVVDFLPNALP